MEIRFSITSVLSILVVAAALLTACTSTATPAPAAMSPAATPVTSAPLASATAQPSPTTPPPSPTPSPTPRVAWGSGLQVISKSNAESLRQVAQISGIFGTDGIQWAWPSDSRPLLAVHKWPGASLTRQMEDWAIYDLGTLRPTVEITVAHTPVRNLNYGIAISPDGQYVAVSGRFNAFKLYDTSGMLLRAFQGHTDRTRYVAFSPNGKWLASTSVDGTLRLWNVASGEAVRVLRGQDKRGFSRVFFSPDSKLLAALGDGVTSIWTVSDGMLLHEIPGQGAAFSPDGKRFASVSQDGLSIEVIDVATWQVLFAAKGHTSDKESLQGIADMSFSPNGTLLASAGYDDRTVRLWDASNGQSVLTLRRDAAVETVAFSPDGRLLATLEMAVDANGDSIASRDNGLHFWGVR